MGPPPTVPSPEGDSVSPWLRTRYTRRNVGLEFDRLANFADAIYAIALTLIVVTIQVPQIDEATSGSDLVEGLRVLLPQIIMFFLVFYLVGHYWLAHHKFVSLLQTADRRFFTIHLLYLAVIAFLPFPAALLGAYEDNPVAVSLFAVSMASASGLETVLLAHAQRADLYSAPLSAPAMRWELLASLVPVVAFVASIPVAFINPWLGYATWLLSIPLGLLVGRRRPEELGGHETAS